MLTIEMLALVLFGNSGRVFFFCLFNVSELNGRGEG